jgi:hypothetical protein
MKQYLVTVLVGYDKKGEPITETVTIVADDQWEARKTASFKGKYEVLSCKAI